MAEANKTEMSIFNTFLVDNKLLPGETTKLMMQNVRAIILDNIAGRVSMFE